MSIDRPIRLRNLSRLFLKEFNDVAVTHWSSRELHNVTTLSEKKYSLRSSRQRFFLSFKQCPLVRPLVRRKKLFYPKLFKNMYITLVSWEFRAKRDKCRRDPLFIHFYSASAISIACYADAQYTAYAHGKGVCLFVHHTAVLCQNDPT